MSQLCFRASIDIIMLSSPRRHHHVVINMLPLPCRHHRIVITMRPHHVVLTMSSSPYLHSTKSSSPWRHPPQVPNPALKPYLRNHKPSLLSREPSRLKDKPPQTPEPISSPQPIAKALNLGTCLGSPVSRTAGHCLLRLYTCVYA